MSGRMISWLALLLLSLPAFAAQDDDVQPVLALRGQRVAEVEFSGDPLPPNARAKFAQMADKEFSPGTVRSALIWFHESGGDSFVSVKAVRSGSRGIVLRVSTRQRLRISEITFDGNNTVPSSVLLQQIDLKEGFEYEPEVAHAAAQKITLFYSKQGYLASDVKFSVDDKRKALKFIINEGEPTLISSITISPLTTVERKDLRERYQREILDAFGLRAGDRIQRDKVIDGIQAIKDWLRDHDFLMARDPNLEYKVAESGTVGISLDINYGMRIRYGFRGNTQFSYRELIAMVGEVKEVSTGSDYLSAVRRRVLEAYKEIGLANAKITTLVREDPARGIRYVSLIVSEGKKIRIDGLNIEGVFSMSRDEARDRFKKLGSRLVQRDYFDEAGINRAAELFAEQLRSEGYLSAKLEYVKLDFNQEHTKVKVSALFTEGVQTKVQSVEIVGAKSFPREEIMEIFGLKEGEPFNIFAFENGLQVLTKEKYQEIGNLNAQVVNEAADNIVRYSKDNTQVFIRVEIDEGPAFRVGEILVRGNKLTHARVVLREVPFITGDLLTAPHLLEAEDNLRKLNLFSDVKVRPIDHPGADDVKDILILVDESDPGTFDIVPGFRNDLGLRLGFDLGYQNLGGWNRSVNASAVVNKRMQNYYDRPNREWEKLEYVFSLGFKEPYLAEWPVVFTSNISFLKRQYHSFDAMVRKFTTGLKRELSRYLDGFIEYGYEQVNIENIADTSPYRYDAKQRNIGTITPGFIVDSRKGIDSRPNPFNPVKGLYSVNRFELASRFLGSMVDIGYYKASTHNSTYVRVYDDIVLALAMNVGWQRSNLTGKAIPYYKLFRLGGLSSIRGYNEDGIDVGDEFNISGTLGMVNYRGELRVPLSGAFGTAFFLDAGNLFVDKPLVFAPDAQRSSVGTGLRYNTAVGPVLLDFAWRLQSDARVRDTCVTQVSGVPVATGSGRECLKQPTDRYKIHFAIGIF